MKKTILLAAMAACLFATNVFAQKIKGSDTCLPLTQTEAENFMNKNKANFRIIDVGYPDIPSGVGMRKEDTALKAKLDKVLEDMHNDGTSKKISEKWFGMDISM